MASIFAKRDVRARSDDAFRPAFHPSDLWAFRTYFGLVFPPGSCVSNGKQGRAPVVALRPAPHDATAQSFRVGWWMKAVCA
jgi:hypothetical protein